MAPPITCEQARELAPELALGVLAGDERGALLVHLAQCAPCRRLAEELGRVTDNLLLLAPEADPPAGFESRVLEGLAPDGAGRAPRWWMQRTWIALGAAAAVLLLALGGGLIGHRLTARSRSYPAEAIASLGGRVLKAGPLVGPGGGTWGQAFVYDGQPSWVFVSMDWDVPDALYTVELDGPGLRPVQMAGLRLADGHGALGHTVYGGDVSRATTVRVLDHTGHQICAARLDLS